MCRVKETIMANDQVAGFEARLQVALDNMPGALVHTDEHLNIVFPDYPRISATIPPCESPKS